MINVMSVSTFSNNFPFFFKTFLNYWWNSQVLLTRWNIAFMSRECTKHRCLKFPVLWLCLIQLLKHIDAKINSCCSLFCHASVFSIAFSSYVLTLWKKATFWNSELWVSLLWTLSLICCNNRKYSFIAAG